jgi:hypothetical protein
MLSKAKSASGGTRICKECGADLPKGKSLKHRACRVLRLCEYCYEMNISPEREPDTDSVIETDAQDYDEYDPWGWIDQFHGDMR